MIRKWFIIFILFPALVWAGFSVDGVTDPASVDGVVEPASVDGVASDYGFTADWTADWDGVGATDERCATTPCPDTFDSVQGTAGRLAVVSDAMTHDCGITAQNESVREAYANQTEMTFKFTLKFSTATDVDAGVGVYIPLEVWDAGTTNTFFVVRILTDAGGEIYSIQMRCRDDGAANHDLSPTVISGLTLTDANQFVGYYKRETGATANDGICSLTFGGLTSEVTNVDNYGNDGLGFVKVGGATNQWGDSSGDTVATIDDFTMYYGVDAR